jgi:hypothetical protein
VARLIHYLAQPRSCDCHFTFTNRRFSRLPLTRRITFTQNIVLEFPNLNPTTPSSSQCFSMSSRLRSSFWKLYKSSKILCMLSVVCTYWISWLHFFASKWDVYMSSYNFSRQPIFVAEQVSSQVIFFYAEPNFFSVIIWYRFFYKQNFQESKYS